MAYLAVSKDGMEFIYALQPKRGQEKWIPELFQVFPTVIMEETAYIQLPKGTIAKLIGKELTWEDEPVKIE